MSTVKLDGDLYKVEYNTWSFIELERDYGVEMSVAELSGQLEGNEMSYAFAPKLVMLGLIEHHSDEVDLQDLMKRSRIDGEVINTCVKAFRNSKIADKQNDEGKKE